MTVPVPCPRANVALLLALPGVALLGRALAHAVTRDRGSRVALAWGLTLALFVGGVHACSLLLHSLDVGLAVATLVLAAGGAVAEWDRRRRSSKDATTGEPLPHAVWLSMIGTALVVALVAMRFWFHDEIAYTGHMSITAEMQNRIYPPRLLVSPDLPLRYHYGFDLVAACLTELLRVQVDRALDLATVLLWCVSWCTLAGLGQRLAGRGGGTLTPPLVLLGSGILLGCVRLGSTRWSYVTTGCGFENGTLNAPTASFFFQHPWALGLPLAMTLALLSAERAPSRPWARLLAMGIAMAVLPLGEIALFATLVPAVIAAEAYGDEGWSVRSASKVAGTALLAACAAIRMGGFFARVPGGEGMGFVLHAGYANRLWSTLVWNGKSFGLALPLGAAGAWALRRRALPWGLVALGSIALLNGVRYVETGDIVKFATVASIALGVLGAAALAKLWDRAAWWARPVVLLLALGATGGSLAFLFALAVNVDDITPHIRRGPQPLSQDEVAAMTWVRARARAGELVWHARNCAEGWAEWGGVPTGQRSWTDRAFGANLERLSMRDAALIADDADASTFRAKGYAWVVVDEGDPLARKTDAWVERGTASIDDRFGTLRIVHLTP